MSLVIFIAEVLRLLNDLASGKVEIEDARKRAAELQARAPERFTDALKAEIDAKIDGASDR